MDSVVATGIFTIVGVLIGASAAFVGPIVLERAKAKNEVNRAQRMVAAEMLHIQLVLRQTISQGTWLPVTEVDALVPTSAWERYSYAFAGRVDMDLWEELALLYAQLEVLRLQFALNGARQPSPPVGPKSKVYLTNHANKLGDLRLRLIPGGTN
jgi:hypothetical protein